MVARTPATVFKELLAGMEPQTRTFEDLPPNRPEIAADLPHFLGSEIPTEVVVMDDWAEYPASAQMPLVWDRRLGKYRVSQKSLGEASEAVVRFSWYYLRALAALDPALRASDSVLARGLAAIVAAEAVYRRNWAILPAEVEDAAAIVNLLLLYEPGLLPACYGAGGQERAALVRRAVDRMCQVPNPSAATNRAEVMKSVHVDVAWLTAPGSPVPLAEFLPPHQAALEAVVNKVKQTVHNLPLRWRIVAASCPSRFALPYVTSDANEAAKRAGNWRAEFEAVERDIRQEMAQRGKIDLLAPAYRSDQPVLVAMPPSVLRPLMEMAGQLAYTDLQQGREQAAVALAQGNRQGQTNFDRVFRVNADIKRVIDLAGASPRIDLGASSATNRDYGRLVWERMARVAGSPGRAPRMEELEIRLTDVGPIGKGKPITGVASHLLVQVRDRGQDRLLPVGQVLPGMEIRGYLNLKPELRRPRPLTNGLPQEAWFQVVAREDHQVIQTVVLAMDSCAEVQLAAQHSVFLQFGDEGEWRESRSVDPRAQPWVGGSQVPRVARVQPTYESVTIVEFTLTWQRRGQANNFVVLSPNRAARVVVEARPADCGPVDPEMAVALFDRTTLALGRIVTNNNVPVIGRYTPIAGGHVPPANDPWPNPPYAEHPTYALKATPSAVPYAIELILEDKTSVRLGPNNWVLQRTGKTVKEVRVEDVAVGADLVRGLRPDKQVETVRLARKARLPAQTDYRLVELVNLNWARIGGLAVSVDCRPYDEFTYGVAPDTALALPERRGDGTVMSAQTEPAQRLRPMEEAMLVYDAVLATFLPGLASSVQPQPSTRFLEVEVVRGNQTRCLSCGPHQAFPVRSHQGKLEYLNPLDFRINDQILVAEPGSTTLGGWTIRRVTPCFSPGITLVKLAAERRQMLAAARVAQADTAFGNQIGFILARPTTAEQGEILNRPPGQQGGEGDAAGRRDHTRIAGQAIFVRREQPVAPNPTDQNPDWVSISSEGRLQFQQRGLDLIRVFSAEIPNLRPPPAGSVMVTFWTKLLTRPGMLLPFERKDLDMAFGGMLQEVLKQRAFFLTNSLASDLGPLAFSELALASWLCDCGATNSARLLTLDIVEMSLFAGCDVGKERQRLDEGLMLAGLLHAPQLATRAFALEDKRQIFPVSVPALRAAQKWAGYHGYNTNVIAQDGIVLGKFYYYWREKGDAEPYWQPLQVSGTGELAQITREGELDPRGSLAMSMMKWLRRRAEAVPAQEN
jgi:hypothetical protein